MILDHFTPEGSYRSEPVRIFFRSRILEHDRSVLIVKFRNGKRIRGQMIEKFFFCPQVIIKRLVIIEMIMSDVCKNTSGENKSRTSFLNYRMRTHFHESM